MPASLVWLRDGDDRRVFEIPAGGATVGRDGEEAEIVIDEALVSRKHARIEMRGGHWVVRDLGSTNLTRVNGVSVGECVLDHADEICFSRARCVFEVSAEELRPAEEESPASEGQRSSSEP